jgi:hypothetical protein
MWLILAGVLASSPAEAACESLVRRATASSGTALATNFKTLARCSQDEADASFDSLLPRAKNVDTLVALSMAAIEVDVWNPVWRVLDHDALDYDVRDQISGQIGSRCESNPKIVAFLKGAYFALRGIQFQQWDDAFIACQSPDLNQWLIQQAEKPPSSMFDEKYNALLGIVGARMGADALPVFANAAIQAANDGPFDAILMQMDAAVQPGIGEPIKPDEQVQLEKELVKIASAVNRDKARSVADRLANAGATEAASQLLPTVYPDRMTSSGGFEYGAASIERADCDGKKTVVIHLARVEEPGKRWIILNDIRVPMQSVKPKLGKCTTEGSEWGVSTTPEPIASSKDVDNWLATIEKQWSDKGYAVSTRKEKTIILD